jgi:hypothetical protein
VRATRQESKRPERERKRFHSTLRNMRWAETDFHGLHSTRTLKRCHGMGLDSFRSSCQSYHSNGGETTYRISEDRYFTKRKEWQGCQDINNPSSHLQIVQALKTAAMSVAPSRDAIPQCPPRTCTRSLTSLSQPWNRLETYVGSASVTHAPP